MIMFTNKQEIDIRSISTLGLSVKEGENPIGYFGTGLKYAIAVLLRNKQSVTIFSGETILTFGLASHKVRGQDFDFITMAVNDDQPVELGMTTQLGRDWELWMAYREIACNCRDESGEIAYSSTAPSAESGFTKIVVTGQAFEDVYHERGKYLLEDEPDFSVGSTEIRRRPSESFFYRGVRVHMLPVRSMFTYNELRPLTLTEDRTVKNPYDIMVSIARTVLTSDNAQFIRDVITAPDRTYENGLDFHGWSIWPSATFIQVVGECVSDRLLTTNKTALAVWKESCKKDFDPRPAILSRVQQLTLDRALDFCQTLGFPVRGSYPIIVAETLGEGILGLAHNRQIYIAERCFHMGGAKQVASCLIEEYLHLRHGWEDCTREMQTFLFEKLVSLGEELQGSPL